MLNDLGHGRASNWFPESLLGQREWFGIAELQPMKGSVADPEAGSVPTGLAVVVTYVDYLR